MRLLIALPLLLLAAIRPGAAAEPDYQALATALTDTAIVPAYRNMAAEMALLESATAGYCTAPAPAALRCVTVHVPALTR